MLGACGCCGQSGGGSPTVSYYQAVLGFTPWPCGFVTWPQGNPNSLNATPQSCFLVGTQEVYNPVTGEVYGDDVTTFQTDGTFVRTGPNVPPGAPFAYKPIVYSSPYTIQDAIAVAIAFADQVDLLNPSAVYQVSGYYLTGLAPFNLIYSYEKALPGVNGTQSLQVGAGGIGLNANDLSGVSAINGGVWNPTTSTLMMPPSGPQPESMGNPGSGTLIVKKIAVKGPPGFFSRTDFLLQADGIYHAQPAAPIKGDAGEHIYDWTDVPGIGGSTFNQGSAPGLPVP